MRRISRRAVLAVLAAAMLLAGCGAASSRMTRGESSIAGPPVKTESTLPASVPEAEEQADLSSTTPPEPVTLPQDWEMQVLARWMAVTTLSEGVETVPAHRNLSYTLQLEQTGSTGEVSVTLTEEKYGSPAVETASQVRTGELSPGAMERWDGEKSQDWHLTCRKNGDEKARWTISMMEDGSLLLAVDPEKGERVWYTFRRTEAWDDIGYTAVLRELWGTFDNGSSSLPGIRWMTFLPDGSCYVNVEWENWKGLLTGTATGTQCRTEDGIEIYFDLMDEAGTPCQSWAVLLHDDGSPSGYRLKYRAGEHLFSTAENQYYWKNSGIYTGVN